MPINYQLYPDNWKTEIRPRILKRAGRKKDKDGTIIENACCEFCGVKNYSRGARDTDGNWHDEKSIIEKYLKNGASFYLFKNKSPKIIKIVLTIAHLDRDPENWAVKDERLAALCQRCHLNYDRKDNRKKKAVKKYRNSLFPIQKKIKS